MSDHEWKAIYQTIRGVYRTLPRRARRCRFSDIQIVAMYVWTVIHDRPLCWGVERHSYGRLFRPRCLPSYSQFKRRVRSERFNLLLNKVNASLAGRDVPTPTMYVDGKALPVGSDSKDPDARLGRSGGGFRRGFKLHALVTKDGRFVGNSVTSLNACEKREAYQLMLDTPLGDIVLGDGNYDDSKLYELAATRQTQFFAKPRAGAGQGHRRQSAARLQALSLCVGGEPPNYHLRRNIERYFGQLCGFGGSLSPLPAWVRSLPRVQRWVTAKLIGYHARLKDRTNAA